MSKEAVDKDSELYADDVFHNTIYGKVCYSISQNSLSKYVTKTENTYRGSVEVCYGLDCTYTTKIWITDGKHYIDGLTDPSKQDQVTHSFSTEYPESCGVDAIGGGTGGDLTVADFDFTGKEQEFLVLKDGVYALEAWGAQGGTTYSHIPGGYGAYAYAEVQLKKGDKLYVNVGQEGTPKCTADSDPSCRYSYNGGYKGSTAVGGGGGASHIAKKSGQIFDNIAKTDFYIVAAGGSSGQYTGSANGNDGYYEEAVKDAGAYCNDNDQYGRTVCQSGTYASIKPGEAGQVGDGGGLYNPGDRRAGGQSYAHNNADHNAKLYCYNCYVDTASEATHKSYLTTDVSDDAVARSAKIGNGFARITYIGDFTE
jgi:hypothetical protein